MAVGGHHDRRGRPSDRFAQAGWPQDGGPPLRSLTQRLGSRQMSSHNGSVAAEEIPFVGPQQPHRPRRVATSPDQGSPNRDELRGPVRPAPHGDRRPPRHGAHRCTCPVARPARDQGRYRSEHSLGRSPLSRRKNAPSHGFGRATREQSSKVPRIARAVGRRRVDESLGDPPRRCPRALSTALPVSAALQHAAGVVSQRDQVR